MTPADIIIANPPYISPAEYKHYELGIAHEPLSALVAKEDGFYYYPFIKQWAERYLNHGGWLVVECAPRQRAALTRLLRPLEKKARVVIVS